MPGGFDSYLFRHSHARDMSMASSPRGLLELSSGGRDAVTNDRRTARRLVGQAAERRGEGHDGHAALGLLAHDRSTPELPARVGPQEFSPDVGTSHLNGVLRALALYGQPVAAAAGRAS